MLIEMMVPACDFTDEKYSPRVLGGGYLARGATGRWCVVMYAGPKEVARYVAGGGKVLSVQEAYAHIENLGGEDWADF